MRWGGTKADPESGPGCSQPLSPPALLSQWRAPAEEGPQPFNIFHFCISPLYIAPNQIQSGMLNRSSTHQELLQLSQNRRSQPTDLRLISLIVLLSVFHLNTSRQNTKHSLRLSPCVTDWRQRVARWSIYFQLTGASTIQYSWHKWY